MALTTTAELDVTVTALLADSVVAESGKLYVQGGGWNMLNAGGFPLHVPRVGIGLVVQVPYSQTNKPHALRVELADEDGNRLQVGLGPLGPEMAVKAMINVGRPPGLQGGESQNVVLAANIDGLQFETPGTYEFTITVGDSVKARLPFRIVAPVTFG